MSGVIKNQPPPPPKQWSVHSLQNWTQGTSEQDFQAEGPAAKSYISLAPKPPWTSELITLENNDTE